MGNTTPSRKEREQEKQKEEKALKSAEPATTDSDAKDAGDSGDAVETTQAAPEGAEQAGAEVSEAKEDAKESWDGIAVRREIRAMSDEEHARFFDALDKMMENKDGVPGTSEFFRLAGYHGRPEPYYCSHGAENFPAWHRIYLREFEKGLQEADRQLGRDGNVFLPYWDWTTNHTDGLPKIVRERQAEWPKDLFPKGFNDRLFLSRATDHQIRRGIERYQVIEEARDCLLATQHFVHAGTGNEWASSYPSLESPHNSMHVIVGGNGGPMGGVAYAAFDIAFWLHHCNVDRIYEAYLEIEPDSMTEFEENQNRQQRDLFDEPLQPFKKEDGSWFHCRDIFNPRDIGFVYDALPPAPAAQLRVAPTVVIFPNVRVVEFESKCYQVHVFLMAKDAEFTPPENVDALFDHPQYAGSRGVFGRGEECDQCKKRTPYDIIIDVTDKMAELGLSRYDVKIEALLYETNNTNDVFVPLADTPLPQPFITGPQFEDREASLNQTNGDANNTEEVRALQRYLARFGYYADEKDGLFGPITEQAVKDYQAAAGIDTDGSAGPITKEAILTKKRCGNVDPFAQNEVKDEETKGPIAGKKTIRYQIATVPGYLVRQDVEECIAYALGLWSKATGLVFENTGERRQKEEKVDEVDVDIAYSWGNQSEDAEKNVNRFDGPGGVLGHGGEGYVVFDIAERWVIGITSQGKVADDVSDLKDKDTWYRGSQPRISLFYTALHETGHALGLDHSRSLNDVMGPYYNPQKVELSENDATRAAALYASEQ